jgi:hypothetical protein
VDAATTDELADVTSVAPPKGPRDVDRMPIRFGRQIAQLDIGREAGFDHVDNSLQPAGGLFLPNTAVAHGGQRRDGFLNDERRLGSRTMELVVHPHRGERMQAVERTLDLRGSISR